MMNNGWWSNNIDFLNDSVSKINLANDKDNPVDRVDNLFKGLNQVWIEFYFHRKNLNELSDNERRVGEMTEKEGFIQLLQQGMSDNNKRQLINSYEFKNLINLNPQILNQKTLKDNRYNPYSIPDDLGNEAQKEHRKLIENYQRFSQRSDPNSTIKSLSYILYVVRSNIAHGEKTPQGPDLEKVKRDKSVCRIVEPILRLIIQNIFDFPDKRLAVYGTLAPEQPNEHILKKLQGNWSEIKAQGDIEETDDSFRGFVWDVSQDWKEMKMFESNELPNNLESIDKFEGLHYQRNLIPVKIGEKSYRVANIYEFKF